MKNIHYYLAASVAMVILSLTTDLKAQESNRRTSSEYRYDDDEQDTYYGYGDNHTCGDECHHDEYYRSGNGNGNGKYGNRGRGNRGYSERAYYERIVRDYQRQTSQFTAGKNFPASGAFGPYLVTADEIPDPAVLKLETRLNGAVMQKAPISDMRFGVADLVAYCSTFTQLEPGDV